MDDVYIEYTKTFSPECSKITVVFDRYLHSKERTKTAENLRRIAQFGASADVEVSGENECKVSQKQFLTNSINKDRFIKLLRSHLNENNIKFNLTRL